MDKLKTLLDHNLTALCEAEPYFAPNFAAARVLLDAAKAGNGGLTFGATTCGPHGCSCGNRACLHQTAWRVYVGVR
jgi:hypothetical protein